MQRRIQTGVFCLHSPFVSLEAYLRIIRRPSEDLTARGQALWQNIYAPHDVKLAGKLGSYHPDFIGTPSI